MLPGPLSRPAAVVDLLAVWPAPTQWVAVGLLCLALVLLSVQVWGGMPGGAEPLELQAGGTLSRFEVNTVSRAELMQMPGVGPGLADKIVRYREEHGIITRVEQLDQVPGIGPKTLELLRNVLYLQDTEQIPEQPTPVQTLQAPVVKPAATRLDVNTASFAELQALPRIGPTLALRIIEERRRRAFTSVDDLRRVHGIGVKTLEQVRPYVTVGK
jgi:competence ComEA-like helix-hairpin-helix protein